MKQIKKHETNRQYPYWYNTGRRNLVINRYLDK